MKEKSKAKAEQKELPAGGYLDQAPALDERLPAGPIELGVSENEPCLLLFAPRNTISNLIDRLTGGYGYSHLAIDCGDVDRATGRKVMIEVTLDPGVHYAFQDEYGDRPFVRIPLLGLGMDPLRFCEAARSRLGEKYDDEEALTLGALDDPAKQICSDLATVSLPVGIRRDIAASHRAGLIHPLAVVRHGKLSGDFRLFISPNGFAEYLGAPRGHALTGPNQLSLPTLPDERFSGRRYLDPWKLGALILGCLALGLITYKILDKRRQAAV
ncbi:MAG TPA: hypothetical protein VF823_01640 [Anaerolineales bacterium]